MVIAKNATETMGGDGYILYSGISPNGRFIYVGRIIHMCGTFKSNTFSLSGGFTPTPFPEYSVLQGGRVRAQKRLCNVDIKQCSIKNGLAKPQL